MPFLHFVSAELARPQYSQSCEDDKIPVYSCLMSDKYLGTSIDHPVDHKQKQLCNAFGKTIYLVHLLQSRSCVMLNDSNGTGDNSVYMP